MSTDRIIKKIEENSFDYKSFSIKRIGCQYENSENSASFRANLKTQKDESVLVTFSKMNIAVGRVLLTPDSVKYINFLDKKYFLGDYGFLRNLFNIDINFEDIQAILSNNVFSFKDIPGKKDFRNYTSTIDSGRYVLQSIKNRKPNRIESGNNPIRNNRVLKRNSEETPILQTIIVRPDNFNIEKIRIEDKTNNQHLEFDFGDYTGLEGKDYPSLIDMNFNSGPKIIHMKLRLGGFSTEAVDSLSFNIPSKYDRIVVN
jgi:hypothetical protein